MKVDINKEYRTRGGHKVTLYTTEAGGVHPVHGRIELDSGESLLTSWREDGTGGSEGACCNDLVEVKQRIQRQVWLNVYDEWDRAAGHLSRLRADRAAALNFPRERIACVRVAIDVEHGHGLEGDE